MLGRSAELPLARDGSNRYLPWIVAFMVYLAVLALAGAMVLSSNVSRWGGGLSGTLTVQIMADRGGSPRTAERTIEKTIAVLRATPGIIGIRVLERAEVVALLDPWLGAGMRSDELPLPQLIDVTLDKATQFDHGSLLERLSAAVPGATVDDHERWLADLLRLARSVELITLGVVVLTMLVAIVTVIFAARTGLALHHHVIELLHLIGAQDSYIASQFQYHALWLGLRGGLLGLLLGALSLYGIGQLARRIESPILPELTLSVVQWTALGAVPLVTALIAMLTARLTVMRTLSRMS